LEASQVPTPTPTPGIFENILIEKNKEVRNQILTPKIKAMLEKLFFCPEYNRAGSIGLPL
jgi:hypothetical protein